MRNDLYAGFDLGTTFVKVGLCNEQGVRVGLGHRPFVKDEDTLGRCTVPVSRLKEMIAEAFREALAEAGCTPAAIRGVSYCSQANTFLLLDNRDRPLTPLIVWPDLRAAPLSESLAALTSTEAFLQASGQGLMGSQWMPAKLEWFRRQEPELWHRTAQVLTISDYLSFLLTGQSIGDSGTAALTGLWELRQDRWNAKMLDFLELKPDALPELHRPGALTVGTGKGAAEWLGIPEGTPFTVGALDHHAAALGGGIGREAPVSVSFGTSLVCFRFEDHYAPALGSCLGPATDPGRFYRIAFNAPGAAAMDWYRSDYAPQASIEELLASAERVPPGCDGLRAVSENGAIRFETATDAAGIRKEKNLTFNAQRSTLNAQGIGQGHYVRAVMELTGRNTAALLKDLARGAAAPVSRILAVGGAAKSDLWMQVVEETSGVAVSPARPADTAAKGAALFAAMGAGARGGVFS